MTQIPRYIGIAVCRMTVVIVSMLRFSNLTDIEVFLAPAYLAVAAGPHIAVTSFFYALVSSRGDRARTNRSRCRCLASDIIPELLLVFSEHMHTRVAILCGKQSSVLFPSTA